MHRIHLLILFCVAAVALVVSGCTKTVYLVQQPDGSFAQTAAPQPKEPAQPQPVILVKNPDGTLSPVAVNPDGTPVVLAQNGQATQNPDGTVTVQVDPTQNVQISDDVVILDVLTSNNFVHANDGGPIFLQITLGAKDLESHSRSPLNVSLVIDRSGSMSGQKMRDVKAAATWLVDNLADEDRVHIVSYASDVRVDGSQQLTKRGRRKLISAISEIQDGGGTFLSGGLEAGAIEIAETFDRNTLSRVILLSDGNANEGITSMRELGHFADGLREKGISVSTMGVGVDYNEDLMEEVAVAGGGNYHFIQESQDVANIFDVELASLGNTVVRDAVLILELPNGVQVEEVFGFKHKQEGDDLHVFMNSVSAGEKKRLLISLDVPRKKKGDLVIAEPRLEFHNEIEDKDVSRDFNPVMVSFTTDNKEISRNMNKTVMEKVELVRNAEVKKEVFSKLESGDRAGAIAAVERRKQDAAAMNAVVQSEALDDDLDSLMDLEETANAVPADKAQAQAHRKSKDFKAKKKSGKAAASDAFFH